MPKYLHNKLNKTNFELVQELDENIRIENIEFDVAKKQ